MPGKRLRAAAARGFLAAGLAIAVLERIGAANSFTFRAGSRLYRYGEVFFKPVFIQGILAFQVVEP